MSEQSLDDYWDEYRRIRLEIAVDLAHCDLELADIGYPPPIPDPDRQWRESLARAYARAGVARSEVGSWEDSREDGEDIGPALATLAALRGTPWDAGCRLPDLTAP